MVKMWAEKEMRNLARLHSAGIRCPKPVQLRMHVLVMDFIGQNSVAAPRLKVYWLTSETVGITKYYPAESLKSYYAFCYCNTGH